jgi:hypothetical protein
VKAKKFLGVNDEAIQLLMMEFELSGLRQNEFCHKHDLVFGENGTNPPDQGWRLIRSSVAS